MLPTAHCSNITFHAVDALCLEAHDKMSHISFLLPPGIEPGFDVSLMLHLSYHWTTVVEFWDGRHFVVHRYSQSIYIAWNAPLMQLCFEHYKCKATKSPECNYFGHYFLRGKRGGRRKYSPPPPLIYSYQGWNFCIKILVSPAKCWYFHCYIDMTILATSGSLWNKS